MRTYKRKQPNYEFIENVQELCRLCLSKTDNAIPIFSGDTENVCALLPLRIMICVGLEVKHEEFLPNIICADCLDSLNHYYTFRKKCEVSYQRLKSHKLAVKQRQSNVKLEENDSSNTNATESDQEMKLIVTFDKEHFPDDGTLNLNGVANKLSGQVEENSTENILVVENNDNCKQESYSPSPDITTFLSTMLLQIGLLNQKDDGLVLTEHSISTLELEIGDGSQITLELVEEDEPELIAEGKIITVCTNSVEQPNTTDEKDVVIKYVQSDKVAVQIQPFIAPVSDISKKSGTWCEICGKKFASRSTLKRHRRVHSGEKPYACQHCGRKFAQREVMQRHALIHKEKRPFACSSCPKSFTQRGSLEAHARRHAPPHARPLHLHRCAVCPKVFLYASGLSRHMMMHQGRVYECGSCSRQFRDKSSLMRHLKNTNHDVDDTLT